MEIELAVKILAKLKDYQEDEEKYKALSLAIAALEKEIAKNPIISAWSPAYCPTCGTELSYFLGDGCYKHSDFLERCSNTNCCQRLKWLY